MIQKKKWTVMVYLAGDNNLDTNGIIDLMEMKKTGCTSEIHVIAQFDRAGADRPTSRYCLSKGTSLEADRIASMGETNTGKPEVLLDFIQWGIEKYPADYYMIILWNHGQGWDDTDIFASERAGEPRLMRANRIRHALFESSVKQAALLSARNRNWSRAILIDDDARDFLDSLEMKAVAEKAKKLLGRKIDILGLDACLMNMAEVGYQMQSGVHFMVGSEETEPLDGWPYDAILSYLAENPESSPLEISKNIVKQYVASYIDKGEAVTQSACDLTAFSGVVEAMTRLTQWLIKGLSDSATLKMIIRARNKVQEYQVKDNVDLIHFCQLLSNMPVSEVLADACRAVIAALTSKNGAIIASAYHYSSMENSNGLAIYFPTRTVSSLYERLDFAEQTGWGTFIKMYTTALKTGG